MQKSIEHVEKLIEMAVRSAAYDAGDAMKLTQAAVNAANALCSLLAIKNAGTVTMVQK